MPIIGNMPFRIYAHHSTPFHRRRLMPFAKCVAKRQKYSQLRATLELITIFAIILFRLPRLLTYAPPN